MNLDGHEESVGGFAASINSRLVSEARVAKAIGFAWLCGGAAIALCLTGLGFASAFLGYSHMLSVKPAAEKTAKALVEAFQRTELRTNVSGTMSLASDSEVRMAAGQTVTLNEGAVVKLDENSSVRIIGDLKIDMPQPSKRQLQLNATSKSDELPFTNYTVFRNVGYGAGDVVTGWDYDLSDTTRPKVQFCYYTQSVAKGLSAKYTIAVNGSPRRPSGLEKLSFNFDEALSSCIWFSGA
jgi:hypothetical protein